MSARPVRGNVVFAAFPQMNSPLVDLESGQITRPWQRLLIALFQKTGGGTSALPDVIYLESGGTGVTAYNALSGNPVGVVPTSTSVGGPPVTVVLGSNPFTYTPGASGQLVVPGGKLELSRNGSVFGLVGLQGGALRLLAQDSARMTWFSTDPPAPVIWYPDVAP